MEQCQGCGLFFKRLSSHIKHCKVPNKALISTDINNKERSETGEICPKCKQHFKLLASHIPHCKGEFIGKVSTLHTESHEKRASHEETCPGCRRTFKRLASHLAHCKGTYSADVALIHAEFQQKEAFRDETCPKCYTSFKNLASHSSHCKGVLKEEAFSKSNDGLQRQSSSLPSSKSNPDVETCPKNYHNFMQLSSNPPSCEGKHMNQKWSKCNATFEKINSHLTTGQEIHEEEIYSRYQKRVEEDGACPMCGQYFKRVASHLPYCKMKFSEETCPKCDQSFKRLASHLPYCKGKEDEETCPLCSKTFKRLSSHFPHCKGNLQEDSCPKISLNSKLSISQLKEMRTTESVCETEIDVINDLRELFLQELNKCEASFHWSIFSTGSYYDRTKTTNTAGDYDFILYPDVKCRADFVTEAKTLGYCKVTVCKDEPMFAKMKQLGLIKKHDYLSPGSMKKYIFEIFDNIIKNPDFRQGRRIHRLYRSPSSPAFTILYDAGSGIQFEVDLVPGIHFEGWPKCDAIRKWKPKWKTNQDLDQLKKEYFCVAREHPHVDEVPDGQMLWRESFSHTEKLLWKHADGARHPPTCRKPVLKALKSLLSECRSDNPNIKHLSTFHLRTFMLHAFDDHPSDEKWDKRDMSLCLKETKKELKIVLQNKILMNYFVPGHNVLQEVPETEATVFISYLNQSLNPNKMQQK